MPNRSKALILCEKSQWRTLAVDAMSSYGLQCFAPRDLSDLKTISAPLPTMEYAFWIVDGITSDYSTMLDGLFDNWPDAEHIIIMCQSDNPDLQVHCKKTLLAKIAHCYLSSFKDISRASQQVLEYFFPDLEATTTSSLSSAPPSFTTSTFTPRTPTPIKHNRTTVSSRVRQNLITDKLIVVASSTGGVQALTELLSKWPDTLTVPVLIAHHLPARFQSSLGEILQRVSSRTIQFVDKPMALKNGVYISPFDYHVSIKRHEGQLWAEPHQGPKEHFLRPAADPLFRSAGDLDSTAVIGVVLTGMGRDGTEGCQHIVNNGGQVICQDEQSSVVWGMPKQVYDLGITEGAFHPSVMGLKIQELFKS